MSMIEKFLESKEALCKNLDNLREEALKAVEHKADALVDEFVNGVKTLVTEASDAEFIEFITSGKLDDDDIVAAIAFHAEARNNRETKACSEPCEEPKEKHGHRVRVLVVG